MGSVKRFVTGSFAAAVVLGLFASFAAHAAGNNCTYIGPNSGSWDTAGNWSGCGGVTPSSGDKAIITSGTTVNIGAGAYSIGTLQLDGLLIGAGSAQTVIEVTEYATAPVTLTGSTTLRALKLVANQAAGALVTFQQPLTLDAATIELMNGTVEIASATLTNNSSVFGNSAGLTGSLNLTGGTLTIQTGSSVVMQDQRTTWINTGSVTIDGSFEAGVLEVFSGTTLTLATPALFSTHTNSFVQGAGTITTGSQNWTLSAGVVAGNLSINVGTATLTLANMGFAPGLFGSVVGNLVVNGNVDITNTSANFFVQSATSYSKLIVNGNLVAPPNNAYIYHAGGYTGLNGRAFDFIEVTGAIGGSPTPTSSITTNPAGYSYNSAIQTSPNRVTYTQTAGPKVCQFIPASGAWSTAANWGGDCAGTAVPGASDRAEINGAKTATVGPTESLAVGDLVMGGAATIQGGGARSILNVNNATTNWPAGTPVFQNLEVQLTGSALMTASSFVVDNAKFLLGVGGYGGIHVGAVTIENNGRIDVGNFALYLYGNVTIRTGGTLRGLSNSIIAPNASLTVDIDATASFANSGILQMLGGYTLTFPGTSISRFTHDGLLNGNGTITGLAGNFTNSGVFSGNWVLNVSNFFNAGILTIGDASIGSIVVNGSYFQGASGVLNFRVDGAANYDQLTVNGSATFDSSSVIAYGGGAATSYLPLIGDVYDVVRVSNALSTSVADYTCGGCNFNITFAQVAGTPNVIRGSVASTINIPLANVEVFNTGVNSTGGLLALGSVDPHYQLTVSADPAMPGPAAYVANPIPTGYWIANGPASQWIAPAVDQSYPNPPATCNAAGNYTYRTTFDLTGFSLPSVVLNGNWAVDNTGISILLNGNATGVGGSPGYGAFSPFTLSTGFVSGMNTLDFVINDSGCPSGLRVELSGTGNATTASYSPALGLTFGNVTQSTTSAPLQAVFTNTSPVSLSLSSISFVGGGAGFNVLGTSQCLSTPTLAPGASCTFDVTAMPASTGILKDAIRVVTSPANAGAPSVLALSVTGVPVSAAALGVSTGALSFGNVALTRSSAVQTLTLTNSGNATLNFTSAFAITGDFTYTTTCGSTLAAAATCTVDVTFSPTVVGARSGTLTIASDAPSTPDVISLSGTGAALPTLVSFSTASVAPGGTVDLVMKLTNFANHPSIGAAAVLLNYPAGFTNQAPGAFPQAGCASTLGSYTTGGNSASVTGGFLGGVGTGSTNCNLIWVKVTAPATPGVYTITIPAGGFTYSAGYSFSNAAPITFNVTVTTLTAPTLTFAAAPSTIAAGSPSVGTLTVTNPNAVPLTANPFTFNYAPGIVNAIVPNASSTCPGVTPVAAPGASSSATSTGFTIPANSSCAFSVSITSATPGVYSGNITAGLIVTNGGSTNTTPFSLTVTSGGTAPSVTSGPPAPGTVGQVYNFSFAASGTGPITWSLVTGSLPAGLTLNTSTGAVTGSPTVAGNFAFTVRATNAAGLINLSTAINVAVPIVSIMSMSTNVLNFGNQNVGATSAAQTVVITNTGNAPFSILSFSGIGDFSYTSTCPLAPAVLQPNASCNLNVTFTPLIAGAGAGRISVNNNAAQQGANGNGISLSGTGVTVPRANIVINPSTNLDFGEQAAGSSSAPVVVFVSNTGQAVLELQSVIATNGGVFVVGVPTAADNPRGHPLCVTGNTIAPGASCAMAITFSPFTTGPQNGRIAITHNATPDGTTGISNIAFSGIGAARREPLIRVSGTIAFGDQILGTPSAPQPAMITNIGTAVLNVAGLSITPTNANTGATDFAVSGACDALAPNASCTVGVSFTPTGNVGPKGAQLAVTSNAANAGPTTSTIALLGIAIPAPAPKVQLVPTAVGFGSVLRGTQSAAATVKVTNSGQLPLTITRVDGIPSPAGFYPVSNDCLRTIGAGESCTIVIRFTPGGPGAQRGELFIFSDAPTSPDRVPLTGSGCTLVSPTFRFFVPSC